MSGMQCGLACCACVLSLVLSGCSETSVSALTGESNRDNPSQISVDANGDVTAPLMSNQLEDDQSQNNLGPEGDSSLAVSGRQFPLNAAIGDIWGSGGDHYRVDFTLTNGKFTVVPTAIDGVTHNLLVPARATATLFAELHSPGESFTFVTYSYSPFGAGGGVLAGNAFFENAYIAFDDDRSGFADEHEQLAVEGGMIEFSGVLPDIELTFSLTLEDGRLAEGHYTGLFDFADHRQGQ